MKRSQRMAGICQFTGNKEQEAAKVLGECTQRMEMQQKRLADLEQYRLEYSQQITTAGGNGLTISTYQNMQAFMGNLSRAIEQQKAILNQVQTEYERKKNLWLEARNKNKALNQVTDRYRQQEEMADEKKQQREIDDRFSRQTGGNN